MIKRMLLFKNRANWLSLTHIEFHKKFREKKTFNLIILKSKMVDKMMLMDPHGSFRHNYLKPISAVRVIPNILRYNEVCALIHRSIQPYLIFKIIITEDWVTDLLNPNSCFWILTLSAVGPWPLPQINLSILLALVIVIIEKVIYRGGYD